MNISVVVPVYNEEENILPLAEEVKDIASRFPSLELLFVDDGSRDNTWARIQNCEKKYPFVRGIRSPKNLGQTSALLLGLNSAQGEILVTMDGDLQNNPADIPRLVERLDHVDVVCGYRAKRKDTWSRRVASRIANRVRNWVTHDGIKDTGCTLKAFRRDCVKYIPPLNGAHRFMPAYFKLNGRSIEQIAVDHRLRQHGISKYTNLKRLPRTVCDLFGFLWYRTRYLSLLAETADR